MNATRLVIAQISDTHVRTDDGGTSVRQLRRALDGAKEYKADIILVTGDLVNDERADEYASFAEAIVDPPAPLYVLPGNHDDRDRMRSALPRHTYLAASGHLSYVLDDHPVRIVALDQISPGETHGELTVELAHWLNATLARAPSKPTLVALHHPPFLTHDMLFDRIGLRGADAFASIIRAHPQVTRIICGHHHRVALGQVAHAPTVVAPSTSWAYGLAAHPDQPIAPRTDEEPGWMLHIWTQDSGFASHFMGL